MQSGRNSDQVNEPAWNHTDITLYVKDEADRVTRNDRGQGAAMRLQLLPADHSWPVTPLRNELETEPSNYLLFRLLLQSSHYKHRVHRKPLLV